MDVNYGSHLEIIGLKFLLDVVSWSSNVYQLLHNAICGGSEEQS